MAYTEREALDLIRATATRSVPNVINLPAIDRILADVAPAAPQWHEPTSVLDAANIPGKDQIVLVELRRTGKYATARLTWAARWLLHGGAVVIFSEVVRWQYITPAVPANAGKETAQC